MSNNSLNNNTPDSQTLLNQLVLEFMQEQNRKRKWRWVTRILIILVLLWLAYQVFDFSNDDKISGTKAHIGLIDVKGTIDDSQDGSAENFAKSLSSAYKKTGLKAVIIRINSPGGSPVQADDMYNSLAYYRNKHPDIKIYAVCVDICASAAYYIAAGANEIYANPSSMVGSIGVIYNGFGFVDTLQKLGVTRRLKTAGLNKGFLDPFLPTVPQQEEYLQVMLNNVHQQFISKVKAGRGDRLKVDDLTFSGLFWTGGEAKERGLVDGFASSNQLAREIIKIDTIVNYTYKESVLDRVSRRIGTAIADHLPTAMGLKPGIGA